MTSIPAHIVIQNGLKSVKQQAAERARLQEKEAELLENLAEFAQRIGVPAPVRIGPNLLGCEGLIQPYAALDVIENFHVENNRNKKPALIAMYCSDLRNGTWLPTHQGIAFNEDGKLCDGQNRLWACIECEIALQTAIFFGVPIGSMKVFDSGGSRSAADASRIAGHPLSNADAAIVRFIMGRPSRVSHSITIQNSEVLAHGLNFIHDNFPAKKRGVTMASVTAAVAKAAYHEDLLRMVQFCHVLNTGIPLDLNTDLAAIALYQTIGNHVWDAARAPELHAKAEQAIHLFCKRKNVSKLYAAPAELYPLPEHIASQLR
jgi:hypothetical protein